MSTEYPTGNVTNLLRHALSASWHAGSAVSVPTVMIKKPTSFKSWTSPGEYTAADMALDYFASNGILGDRVRQNLFGYPGLLRDLADCPPWVHVESEDTEPNTDPERAWELRAMIEHIHNCSDEELLDDFRRHHGSFARLSDELSLQRSPKELSNERENLFREMLSLGRAMGVDTFYKNHDAVFDFDEFIPALGAPDLLLWSPPGSGRFWCFTEVKAPGDSLRPSQANWLSTHFDIIRDHYFLTILLA